MREMGVENKEGLGKEEKGLGEKGEKVPAWVGVPALGPSVLPTCLHPEWSHREEGSRRWAGKCTSRKCVSVCIWEADQAF